MDIKKELENRRLAFEERQQAFRERMAFNAQSHNSFLGFFYLDNHDRSTNWIPIENKNNQLSKIRDEYFIPQPTDIYHNLVFEIIDVFYNCILFFLQLELFMPIFDQQVYVQLLGFLHYLDFELFLNLFHFLTNQLQFQVYGLNKMHI